jgi:hypothetical protein
MFVALAFRRAASVIDRPILQVPACGHARRGHEGAWQ